MHIEMIVSHSCSLIDYFLMVSCDARPTKINLRTLRLWGGNWQAMLEYCPNENTYTANSGGKELMSGHIWILYTANHT